MKNPDKTLIDAGCPILPFRWEGWDSTGVTFQGTTSEHEELTGIKRHWDSQ